MICPTCHNANRDNANFCRFCGEHFALACPRCRSVLLPDSRFCDVCGQPLAEPAQSSEPAAIAQPAPLRRLQPPQPARVPAPAPVESPLPPSPTPATPRTPAPPDRSSLQQYMPEELLSRLEAARTRGEMVGERRIVTMLFCDVIGSTSAAERLDPEEWTEIINGAFEHMIRPIYTYEGTVARLMGDAILAFFGAPIAHEDDPQRAVLAGLDIVEGIRTYREEVKTRWGLDFNVRVGINTGPVVVGAVGSDLHMEYTALGDATNVAARMEQSAAPGTVQIAESTYRLVRSLFDFEPLGAIAIKGKDEPIPSYRVLSANAQLGHRRGIVGLGSTLVGRERELRLLQDALDQVLVGNGRIICLVGEAGLGKSRLIDEMRRAWEEAVPRTPPGALADAPALAQLARWHETASLSFETNRPYGLFQNFIRQVCGATPNDRVDELKRKLMAFVSALPPEAQKSTGEVLFSLFSLDAPNEIGSETGNQNGNVSRSAPRLGGEEFKRRFFAVMENLVRTWATDVPGVMVCDDVHWSDPASVELLLHLIRLTDRLPLILICAMRPDRQAPAWQITVKAEQEFPHRYQQIELQPLSTQDGDALIQALLTSESLPDTLREEILRKSAGNPFFLEEVVRTLIDSGVIRRSPDGGWTLAQDADSWEIDIPDSLQSLLMARIDRLQEQHRRTLQLAALIGRTFYYRVLEVIYKATSLPTAEAVGDEITPLDQQLSDLQRMELIQQAARLPELEYAFRHVLIQESAYGTILRRQRRHFHLQVGEVMEELFAEVVDQHAPMLAYHFSEAGDAPRAMKYAALAGDEAFRLYANTEAVAHYGRAIETAVAEIRAGRTVSHDFLKHLYTSRGRAMELTGQLDRALAEYDEVLQLARDLGDRDLELAALVAMATLRCTPTAVYNFALGKELSEQALDLARALDNRAAEARILWNMLNLYRFSNHTQEAIECGERSLVIARELNLREQMAYTLNDLAHIYNRFGRYDRSKEALSESNKLWRELGNMPMLADNLSTAGYVHVYVGEFDDALAFSEEAFQISRSTHNAWGVSYSRWMVGIIYWMRGEYDLASEIMQESVRLAEEAGFVVAQVYTRADLGLMFGSLGAFERGLTHINAAITIAEKGPRQLRPYALIQLTQLYVMAGDYEAAQRTLDELDADPNPRHMVQPRLIAVPECQVAAANKDYSEALKLLSDRESALRLHGMRSYLPETLYIQGQVLQEIGQDEAAQESYMDAYAEAERLDARHFTWQIQAELAAIDERLGNSVRAAELLRQARTTLRSISDRINDLELRASFLALPSVRKVLVGADVIVPTEPGG